MIDVEPKVGQTCWVKWKARDIIGYGVERGSDKYAYLGRGLSGKLTFEREDGQRIYLFDDEIVYCEREP